MRAFAETNAGVIGLREGWIPLTALISFALILPSTVDVSRFHGGFFALWFHYGLLLALALILIGRSLSWVWIAGLVAWATGLSTIIVILPLRVSLIFSAGWESFAADGENGWLLTSSQWMAMWQLPASIIWRDPLFLSVLVALIIGPALVVLCACFYRWSMPMTGIALGITAAGIGRFFSRTDPFTLYALVVVGMGCAVVWHQQYRELGWHQTETDFSENIRLTSGVAGVAIGLFLVFFGAILPAIPYRDIAETIEDALTFRRPAAVAGSGGVGQDDGAQENTRNQSETETGPSTLLPTSYLIDGPPDLAETPVFEATIDGLPANPADFHWQIATFDQYSGFGWARSRERAVDLQAGSIWGPGLDEPNTFPIHQTITWLGPPRSNFLITGQLHRINQPVTVFERTENDLVRIRPNLPEILPSYTAIATTRQVDRTALNQVDYQTLASTTFYKNYTQLPDNISQRVRDLALEVTAAAEGPYDQAVALETHLRTYEYSLDLEPVPPDREPVDFFLFDLQRGYCDYYATSMVVMARSLGLPARLGVGFNTVTPDEEGRIIITRDRGHSWAEIYFPEFGWVEFEPTATFPTSGEISPFARDTSEILTNPNSFGAAQTNENTFSSWWVWLIIATLFLAGWLWLRQNRHLPAEITQQAVRSWAARGDEWAQLREAARRSGFLPVESFTPREFLVEWGHFLNAGQPFHQLGIQFAGLLEKERYGPGLSPDEKSTLRSLTKEIRRLIRLFD